jgi:hypothetical protein
LQKQNDTLHDQQNQKILNSVLNKNQIMTDNNSRLPTPSTSNPEETTSLFVHIQTNHTNPIESIKGTKLYYLILRKEQCAHLI